MIAFLKGAYSPSDFPDSNKEIVFVGRSNVGKSSLINALYGKIAYVGKTPGKTAMLNFFEVDHLYTVCDVPGYGYAKRSSKEMIEFGNMMEKYFSFRDCLKLAVLILDIRRTPNDDDLDMVSFFESRKIPYIFVLNKADKLSYSQMLKSRKQISEFFRVKEDTLFCTSTTKKSGVSELKDFITEKIS